MQEQDLRRRPVNVVRSGENFHDGRCLIEDRATGNVAKGVMVVPELPRSPALPLER